jgi:hypothetical protein
MSLVAESLGTRGRTLSSIGIPLRLPTAARLAPSRTWARTWKRRIAPFALAACDLVETTIEAAGFGLLLASFLFTIYMLG